MLLIFVFIFTTINKSRAELKSKKVVLVIYDQEKVKNKLALLLGHFGQLKTDKNSPSQAPANTNLELDFTPLTKVSSLEGYDYIIYLSQRNNLKLKMWLQAFPDRLLLLPGTKSLKATLTKTRPKKLKKGIFQSGNIFWLPKNPLATKPLGQSYLNFADFLHDFFNVKHQQKQLQAVVRVEDVHPKVDLKRLKQIIDLLYLNQVPFSLAVIPVYKANPKAKPVYGSKVKGFKEVLKYAQKRGGSFILHGYTHQLQGKTAVDAEFINLKTKKPLLPFALEQRAKQALKEMQKMGIKAAIWETPHYQITTKAHARLEKHFQGFWERLGYLWLPYVSKTLRGTIVIPENAGYVQIENFSVEKILTRAAQLKQVRCGTVGFFYHPFLPPYPLAKTITLLKQRGIKFISANQLIGESVPKTTKPTFLDQALYDLSVTAQEFLASSNFSFFTAIFLLSLLYYFFIIYLFRHQQKSHKVNPAHHQELFFVFVVPALNEELVIKKTVKHLLEQKHTNYLILVIDDHSTDNTIAQATSVKSKQLRVLQTPAASCQRGKGEVLNFAYQKVLQFPEVRRYGRQNIILSVIDADGRIEPNVKEVIGDYFQDPKVGAVQIGVKISNEKTNLLTRWQDYEFQVFCYIFQTARNQLGSVGLGGNGQFIRLLALDSLGSRPWNDCLTEDLDIGLRLMLNGWKNSYCPFTFVKQQGLPQLKPLLRQRTRWIQGHFTCWRYLGQLMQSKLNFFTKLDVAYYLLIPATVFWVVPANYLALFYFFSLLFKPALWRLILNMYGYKVFIFWYLLMFTTIPYFAYAYQKATRKSFWACFLLAHLFVFTALIWLIAGYKAVYRLVKGRNNWVKTPRVKEQTAA